MFSIPGPLWLIKKRFYIWGLLLCILHYTTPMQVMLITQWNNESWWQCLIMNEQNTLESIPFFSGLIYHSYVVLLTRRPIPFLLSIFIGRIITGLLSVQIFRSYSRRGAALYSEGKEDLTSAWAVMAGIYTSISIFLLAHIPRYHCYCADFPDNDNSYTYAQEEMVISFEHMIHIGLAIVLATVLYILWRAAWLKYGQHTGVTDDEEM